MICSYAQLRILGQVIALAPLLVVVLACYSGFQPSSRRFITMSLSSKLSITDVDLKDQRVLIRVDFNVPSVVTVHLEYRTYAQARQGIEDHQPGGKLPHPHSGCCGLLGRESSLPSRPSSMRSTKVSPSSHHIPSDTCLNVLTPRRQVRHPHVPSRSPRWSTQREILSQTGCNEARRAAQATRDLPGRLRRGEGEGRGDGREGRAGVLVGESKISR